MSLIRLYIATQMHKLAACKLYLRVCFISCLVMHSVVATASDAILIIQDSSNDVAEEIVINLSKQHADKSAKIDVLDLSTQPFPDNNLIQAYSYIVTIGAHAAEVTLGKNPPIPSLSLLISKQSWAILNQQYPDHLRSAILLDQPISRQLHLIRELFGTDNNIGLLLGPYSAELETEIIKSAKILQQKVTIKTIHSADELIPVLGSLSDSVDLLLAQPDPVVYNKRSIQGILLLTYRSRTPVIGFSQSYSRAGAMASLYSSAEDIAKQAIEIILAQSTDERLYYPKYFTISFNQQVARALGMSPPDEKKLIEQINQKEK